MTVPAPGVAWPRVLALAGVGLVIGTAGAFVQAQRDLVGERSAPWGVVLVLVTLVLVVRGGAWWVRSRWGGAAVALGWLAATVGLSVTSPSGDIAITAGGRQSTYLVLGMLLAAITATLPVVPR